MAHVRKIQSIAAVTVATLLAGSGGVLAQVERSGGGEAQKIMQQYQQLAAERTSLQAQIAQQKKDLDQAKQDLAAMKKERDALKARPSVSPAAVTQAESARQAAEQSLEKYKQSANELVSRFRETATNLKEVEIDREKVRKDLAERNAAFDHCAESNVQLFDISSQIMDRYEKVGIFTKTSASEPFTKITRTRLENLVDEYRARAKELKVSKSSH